MEKIGDIAALQVQRDRIKIKGVGYRPELIQRVDVAALSGGGMIGHHDRSWLIDVHHPHHPTGKGKHHRSVSFGFTSHYAAMRERFGDIADFVAGENVIVSTASLVAPRDVEAGLVIRTGEGDIELGEAIVLAPCREFTSYLLGLDTPAEKEEIADDIGFLDNGMRGFGAGFGGGPVLVRVGDEVWRR